MEPENATADDPFFNIHLELRNHTAYFSRSDYNNPWPILLNLATATIDIGSIYALSILIRVLFKIERNGTDRYLLHYAFSVISYKVSFFIVTNIRFVTHIWSKFAYVAFNGTAVCMCLTFIFVNFLALDWYVEFKNQHAHSICIAVTYSFGVGLWILGILALFDMDTMISFGLDNILQVAYVASLISSPVFVGVINLLGYRKKGEQSESQRYPLTVANYLSFSWLFFAVFALLMTWYEHFSRTLLELFDMFTKFFMFVAWGAPIVVVWYLKRMERYREGFDEILKTEHKRKDECLLQNENDDV